MKKVDEIFWVTGRGCIATVFEDDGYKVGQEIELFNGENLITTSKITGIEIARGMIVLPSRGLLLSGITKNDIENWRSNKFKITIKVK